MPLNPNECRATVNEPNPFAVNLFYCVHWISFRFVVLGQIYNAYRAALRSIAIAASVMERYVFPMIP
jgi:hypothetical protein